MGKGKKGNKVNYDDDKFYEDTSVSSAHDRTGAVPTPPVSEAQADSYADVTGTPIPKGKVDNGLQRTRIQR